MLHSNPGASTRCSPVLLTTMRDEIKAAEQHLQAARLDLARRLQLAEQEVRHLVEMIDSVDALLTRLRRKVPHLPDLGQPTPDTPQESTKAAPAPAPGTARGAILRVLGSEERAFRTGEIVEHARRMGSDAQADTLRSLVSKMQKAGEIEQVARGLYRLPGNHVNPVQAELPHPPDAIVSLVDANGSLIGGDDVEVKKDRPVADQALADEVVTPVA